MMFTKRAHTLTIAEVMEETDYTLTRLYLVIRKEQSSARQEVDRLENVCDFLYSAFLEAEENAEVPMIELDHWEHAFYEYNTKRKAWTEYLEELEEIDDLSDKLEFRKVCLDGIIKSLR